MRCRNLAPGARRRQPLGVIATSKILGPKPPSGKDQRRAGPDHLGARRHDDPLVGEYRHDQQDQAVVQQRAQHPYNERGAEPTRALIDYDRTETRKRGECERKKDPVSIDSPPGLPTCLTDASRLEQILVNLLGNAIRHTPDDSEVRLAIGAGDGKIVLMVEDQGGGIAADEVEQIFDIYVTKATEEGRGVGLGLPLSRRLARLLGGELKVISRPGTGGCFVLELPAAPAE